MCPQSTLLSLDSGYRDSAFPVARQFLFLLRRALGFMDHFFTGHRSFESDKVQKAFTNRLHVHKGALLRPPRSIF